MGLLFVVDGAPPRRGDPSRCADRSSPNARPLFDAGKAVVEASQDQFPIRDDVELIVTTGEPLPEFDGYDAIEVMVEVLSDAGVIADERQAITDEEVLDPTMSGYSIVVNVL